VHSTQSSYAAQDTLSFHLMRLVLVSLQRAVSCMREIRQRFTLWRAATFGPKGRAVWGVDFF